MQYNIQQALVALDLSSRLANFSSDCRFSKPSSRWSATPKVCRCSDSCHRVHLHHI